MRLETYLEVIENTGRVLAEGKRGQISRHLASALERLELDSESWVDTVEGYGSHFQRLAGSRQRLQQWAQQLGQQWFCRGTSAGSVYRQETVTG